MQAFEVSWDLGMHRHTARKEITLMNKQTSWSESGGRTMPTERRPPVGKVSALFYSPKIKKKTPWSESTSELYRPSDRRLSAK
jgi:hypothetical protein